MLPSPSSAAPFRAPAASRRAFLLAGAGLTAALATGCSLVEGVREPDPIEVQDPDRLLLGPLVAQAAALSALVAASATLHPRLTAALEGLRLTHEDHLRVLREVTGGSSAPATPSTSPTAAPKVARGAARALARLRSAESAHLTAVLDAARSARRGELARLLACMGAGLTQHELTLPAEVPR